MATSSSPASPAMVEVAVIGSARIGPEDGRYEEAVRLGAALADQGWTVITGGYGGLMGATATGARSRGGHTVGLPMRAWDHLEPHGSNAELRWSVDYAERMRHLLAATVVVALPGGVGTLAEAGAVWAAAQTEPDAASLVVVGPGWARLLEAFGRELVVDAADLALARTAMAVDDVVRAVRDLLEQPSAPLSARG
ncbi:MAG: LOG family protein [Actinomycetales bacterium]